MSSYCAGNFFFARVAQILLIKLKKWTASGFDFYIAGDMENPGQIRHYSLIYWQLKNWDVILVNDEPEDSNTGK